LILFAVGIFYQYEQVSMLRSADTKYPPFTRALVSVDVNQADM